MTARVLPKKARASILSAYESAVRFLWDASPYLVSAFQEATEATVVEAKQEVDAFMAHALASAGLVAQAPALPKGPPRTEITPALTLTSGEAGDWPPGSWY